MMKVNYSSLASRFATASLARMTVVVLVSLAVALSAKSIVDTNAKLDQSHEVFQHTLTVNGLMSTLEINLQSFMNSGDRAFLTAFYNQKGELDKEINLLQQALADQPEQKLRIEDIIRLINDWITLGVEPGLANRPNTGTGRPPADNLQEKIRLERIHAGNALLGAVKGKLTTLEAEQKQQLRNQQLQARKTAEWTRFMIIAGTLVIIGTGLVVSLLSSHSVTRRLKRLVRAAKEIAEGNIDITSDINSADEIGALSRTFNQMVQRLRHVEEIANATAAADFSKQVQVQVQGEQDRLAIAINKMSDSLQRLAKDRQNQDWLKTGQTELHYRMRNEHDLIPLAQVVITFLANYLKAQVGVCYLAQGERLTLVAGYGHKIRNAQDREFRLGEGLIGQAALEQRSIRYTEHQSLLTINSGMGESLPNDIMVLPLMHEDKIEAVLALGTSRTFSRIELEYLERVAQSIAISIHVNRTQQQLVHLLKESKQQSEELQSQQQELKAANEGLEEHADRLAKSEAALRSKSEELQQLNSELERKKAETEEKNRTIELAKQAVEMQAHNLSRASQYKSEFLANMSHELRTPLNSLLILSHSLATNRQGNLTEEQQEDAKVIYQGGKSLLGLINDILDLSKVEAGKLDIHFEELAIDGLLDSLRGQFSPIATEKGIELILETEQGLPASICSDPLRLEQVLRNLLSNGLKFTQQGSVRLQVCKADPSVHFDNAELAHRSLIAFVVQDTGIGIAADKQHSVFEAFQQGDGSTSRVYGGTGLGLTISRELVRLLGGEIHLQSEAGRGSTFTLYLPLHGPSPDTQGKPALAQTKSQLPFASLATSQPQTPVQTAVSEADIVSRLADDRNRLRPGDKSVLIIEDDPAFARILIDLARQKGYSCLAALTGSSGLQLAQNYQPSAIILDLGLPDIGGRQILALLKQHEQTRHIPVHILSAEDRNTEVLQMGAIGFLTKPVSGQEISSLFSKIETLHQTAVKQVLLVEDDSHSRQAVARLIAGQDIEICAVSSGQEAYDKLSGGAFDCMILDLSLPDISGFELLAQLGRDQRISLPPIVVYTGRGLNDEEYKELNEYTNSIVIKGAGSPDRLLDEIGLFLNRVATAQPLKQPPCLPEPCLQGRKVLLVDDDLRNTYALSKVLREHGLEVSMADNGELALQKLAQEQDIELVLMDIMMPVMDGYQAIQQIRRQPRFANLPIIALTAKAMPADRTHSLAVGASDHCTKPVEVDRLLAMMQLWLCK